MRSFLVTGNEDEKNKNEFNSRIALLVINTILLSFSPLPFFSFLLFTYSFNHPYHPLSFSIIHFSYSLSAHLRSSSHRVTSTRFSLFLTILFHGKKKMSNESCCPFHSLDPGSSHAQLIRQLNDLKGDPFELLLSLGFAPSNPLEQIPLRFRNKSSVKGIVFDPTSFYPIHDCFLPNCPLRHLS